MKERLFVTGGAGFIGSHLTENLLRQDFGVTCYDLVDQRIVSTETIKRLVKYPNFQLVYGDLLDFHKLQQQIKGHDVVIHLAAISSVDRSIRNPHRTFMTNVLGTVNVLEAARLNGIKRAHLASTDEAYGHMQRNTGQFGERSSHRPRNPYAGSKAAAEDALFAYGVTYGMEVTASQGVNTFGPRQALEKLIPRLTVRGILGLKLPVYGSGNQTREWMYVEDHAEGILYVVEHGKAGERYNVGSGQTRENIEVVNVILDKLGLDESAIEYVPDRPGSDKRYSVNTGKLEQLGWKAKRNFDEELPQAIAWYQNNQKWWEPLTPFYPDLKTAASTVLYQYEGPKPSEN